MKAPYRIKLPLLCVICTCLAVWICGEHVMAAPNELTVASPAFADNKPIPVKYTKDGADASPPLHWNGAPSGTIEFALLVDDPDAPRAEPWVHWILYKIPAGVTSLEEQPNGGSRSAAYAGALQGRNSFNNLGYEGPSPPKGHGTHHYRFTLYALNQPLDAPSGIDQARLQKLLSGTVLAQGTLVGTYAR